MPLRFFPFKKMSFLKKGFLYVRRGIAAEEIQSNILHFISVDYDDRALIQYGCLLNKRAILWKLLSCP